MKVDLIALDLDDTLLRTDLTISAVNQKSIERASARGIRVVLASGRNVHSMRAYAETLSLVGPGDYMICSNGAEILHSRSGHILDERRLAPAFCAEIASAIEARGFPWQVYEEGLIHVSRPNDWARADSRLTGQPAILIENREELFANGLIKFVVPGEPARIASLVKELSELFSGRAIVLTSKPYFLEVLSVDADKSAALERLVGMLDISLARVMVVGDAMNDLGMIRVAGFSCAPANAIPEVRAAARYVSSKTNEENAVSDLIERIALAS